MDLFFRKKNRMVDELALQLADHFFKTVPPEKIDADKSDRKSFKKFDRELDKILKKIASFNAKNKLGIYTRARLQNKFYHRLVDLGYNASFVKALNEKLLLELMQSK